VPEQLVSDRGGHGYDLYHAQDDVDGARAQRRRRG
jgi:hypothetical protein